MDYSFFYARLWFKAAHLAKCSLWPLLSGLCAEDPSSMVTTTAFLFPPTLSSCLFLSFAPLPPSLESGISHSILIWTAITLGEGSRSAISRKGILLSWSWFPCGCVLRRTQRKSGWPKRSCSNAVVIVNFLIHFSFYSDIFNYNFDSSYQVLLGNYDTKDSHISLRNDTPMKQAWDWSVLGMEIKGALEQQCYASPLT